MSRIEINQLNTSEFNELNNNETANVVGGWWKKPKKYGYYYKKEVKIADVDVKQVINDNDLFVIAGPVIKSGIGFNSKNTNNSKVIVKQ